MSELRFEVDEQNGTNDTVFIAEQAHVDESDIYITTWNTVSEKYLVSMNLLVMSCALAALDDA